MPVNDYGTVTNITGKLIVTAGAAGGCDDNPVNPEGNYQHNLPPNEAVAIPTKMDQEFFLSYPERYEVQVKGKIISKKTVESAKASTQTKGEEIMKQPKTSKV